MTTETILTNQEISDIWSSTIEEWGLTLQEFEKVIQFSRAIEQAVLQSPEVRRLRDIEAQAERVVSMCGEDGNYLVLTADVDRLRDAMETQS